MSHNNSETDGITYSHKFYSNNDVLISAIHPRQGTISTLRLGPHIANAPVPGRYVSPDSPAPLRVKGFDHKALQEGMWNYAIEQGLNPQKEQLDTGMFHVSPKNSRESISNRGLRKSEILPGSTRKWMSERERAGKTFPQGVFVSNPPRPLYGEDIWKVAQSKLLSAKLDRSTGDKYLTDFIGPNDVQRVGHFFRNSDGHPEIHWHPEEECDGKSIHES